MLGELGWDVILLVVLGVLVTIGFGMTFSRVDADGEATGGVIFMKDGETCFLVEGAEEENCFTDGEPQADGSMETTSAGGDVSTVMPVDGTLEDHVNDYQ